MKLKEKLCSDFLYEQKNPGYHIKYDYEDGLEMGFIAGFEKAKELAIECLLAPSWLCIKRVKDLGESELDENNDET